MRTAILSVALLSAFLIIVSAVNEVEFFPGRSGDIVIQEENSVHEDSFVLLKGQAFASSKLESIKDTQFADLVAHVTGTQPFNVDATRCGFPKNNLFEKPDLNLLFVVDGVGRDDVQGSNLVEHGLSVNIENSYFPAYSISELSTVLTGRSPAAHGIVSPNWKTPAGDQVQAHHLGGLPHSSNIADLFMQTYPRSLVLSASSSLEMAAAMGVHPALVNSDSFTSSLRNVLGFSYNTERNTFSSIYNNEDSTSTSPSLALAQEQFAAAAAAALKANKHISVTAESGALVYTPKDGQSVTFDLTLTANKVLLSEIAFLYHMVADAQVQQLLSDETPDYIAFGFASLKGIRAEYGAESEHFRAAVNLVAFVMDDVRSTLSEDRATATEMVFLRLFMSDIPRPVALPRTEIQEYIYQTSFYSLEAKADFDMYYPVVYTRPDLPLKKKQQLCDTLKTNLAGKATVSCYDGPAPAPMINMAYTMHMYNLDGSSEVNNTNTTDYSAETAAMQIFLWMNIAVVGILVAAIYGIAAAGTEAAKDSLLYRTMRRHAHHQ